MFEMKDLGGNWVKLTWAEEKGTLKHRIKARINWIFINIKWDICAIKRHINNIPKLCKLYIRCKQVNKYLLKEAEIVRNSPPHEPPTEDEVKEFMIWAEENGINFHTRVQPLPKQPKSSNEVTINI